MAMAEFMFRLGHFILSLLVIAGFVAIFAFLMTPGLALFLMFPSPPTSVLVGGSLLAALLWLFKLGQE